MKLKNVIILLTIALISLAVVYQFGRSLWYPVYLRMTGKETVSSVVQKIGDTKREQLRGLFDTYPPKHITLIALKDTNILELWDSSTATPMLITRYDIQAASGVKGPKLREGDRQVPEGMYGLEYLNPNSSYHLSMKLNYPNAFDLKHAKAEGRTEPGTNIFIHGKAVSIGCLAMGDEVIEEIFTLVHDIGKDNVSVIIAPSDARIQSLVPNPDSPAWVSDLYADITKAMRPFKVR